MKRTDSFEKTLMLGKIEGWRRRGWDDRGWDGWMLSLTQWTWIWVNSGSWWWTGRPAVSAVHGITKSQTRLSDWTELIVRSHRSFLVITSDPRFYLILHFRVSKTVAKNAHWGKQMPPNAVYHRWTAGISIQNSKTTRIFSVVHKLLKGLPDVLTCQKDSVLWGFITCSLALQILFWWSDHSQWHCCL